MKIALIAVVATLACVGIIAVSQGASPVSLFQTVDWETEQKFIRFMGQNQRLYGSVDEYKFRLGVFSEALKKIEKLNAESTGAEYGINSLADWTEEEFKVIRGAVEPEDHKLEGKNYVQFDESQMLEAVDWRSSGKVSPVQNQGNCGSCWTFSTAETMGSTYAINTSTNAVNFAEQELVDCVPSSYGCYGCQGGWPAKAMQWLQGNPLVNFNDYPYTGVNGDCELSKVVGSASIKIEDQSGPAYVQQSVSQLQAACSAHGPISIVVDASSWQYYTGGVIQYGQCGTQVDHAVQLVGYTSSYFIVKNSWGTGWGLSGYLHVSNAGNTCNILYQPVYPQGVKRV